MILTPAPGKRNCLPVRSVEPERRSRCLTMGAKRLRRRLSSRRVAGTFQSRIGAGKRREPADLAASLPNLIGTVQPLESVPIVDSDLTGAVRTNLVFRTSLKQFMPKPEIRRHERGATARNAGATGEFSGNLNHTESMVESLAISSATLPAQRTLFHGPRKPDRIYAPRPGATQGHTRHHRPPTLRLRSSPPKDRERPENQRLTLKTARRKLLV